MALLTVPLIDIAPYWAGAEARKREIAQQIGEACRDIGFLIIAGHGVPSDLIGAVDDVSRAFFDLPLEEKLRVVRPAPDYSTVVGVPGHIVRTRNEDGELEHGKLPDPDGQAIEDLSRRVLELEAGPHV